MLVHGKRVIAEAKVNVYEELFDLVRHGCGRRQRASEAAGAWRHATSNRRVLGVAVAAGGPSTIDPDQALPSWTRKMLAPVPEDQ